MRHAALGGLVAVLAACSHGDAPPPAAPRGPTACERAADSMVGAMLARLPASDAPTDQADALRRLIRVRCEQDGWSADATRCLIAMQKLDDAAPCAKLLTDAQQAALVRDQQAQSGAPAGARPGARAGAQPAIDPANHPAGSSEAPSGTGPGGGSGAPGSPPATGGPGHPGRGR